MKPFFDCELEYFPNLHLMQIYTGFFDLENKGLIQLKIKPRKYDPDAIGITNVIVNGKYKVVYDVLDGLTWIPADRQDNLEYFQKNFKADFYFKRSYHPDLEQFTPENCKVFPLGLNYNVHPNKNLLFLNDNLKDKIKYFIKTNKNLKKIFKKKFFYPCDYEFFPVRSKTDRILFLTRLWNPDEAKSEKSYHYRKAINEVRVQCIEACKKEFGDQFTGGLQEDEFTRANYKSLVAPNSLTKKSSYLQAIKEHSICIATTGLHDSIGWKMAEYVAAARAIVSEPLNFQVPGDFRNGVNYLEFKTPDQLIVRIKELLNNKELMMQMMKNNFYYYNNFVKPENLVLNSLVTITNYS